MPYERGMEPKFTEITGTENVLPGRWVRPQTFAELIDVCPQHLANLRTEDRKAGRILPNHPVWRKFGGGIRYWVGEDLLPAAVKGEHLGVYRPRKRRPEARDER